MEEMTTRDKVWAVTLAYLTSNNSFRLSDLPIDESERITAQRVWRTMEHLGILRRGEDPRMWSQGDTGNVLIDHVVGQTVDWDEEADQLRLDIQRIY